MNDGWTAATAARSTGTARAVFVVLGGLFGTMEDMEV